MALALSCAYVADVTPPQERAARFGMLGAAFGIGFIVGAASLVVNGFLVGRPAGRSLPAGGDPRGRDAVLVMRSATTLRSPAAARPS